MNTTVAGNMTSIKVGRFGLILGGLGANVIDRGARQVLCHIAARALTCDSPIALLQVMEATPAQGKSDAALLAAIRWIMQRESVAPEVRQLARVIEGQVAGLLKRRAEANERRYQPGRRSRTHHHRDPPSPSVSRERHKPRSLISARSAYTEPACDPSYNGRAAGTELGSRV